MPKVSVVIPNYNHERYLPARIRSVLDQTYTDFDVLILDDRSPDGSRRVIESFLPDPRVRAIFNETNSGSTFRQWAKGLAETRGDYVWIAESDDISDLRFLETLVPLLDANPSVGMAVCTSVTVDEHDVRNDQPFDFWVTSFGVAPDNLVTMRSDLVMNGREYGRKHQWVPWTTIPNASGVLFRRQALADHVQAGIEMKLCGDTLIYCRILTHFDIARSSQPLNLFRQHTQNVRSKTSPTVFITEALKIQRYVAQHFGAPGWPRSVWRFFTHMMLGGERRAPSGKVPLRRIPRVLSQALAIDATFFTWVARILFIETLADAAWRLRGRAGSTR